MTFEWLAYSPSEELVTLDRVVNVSLFLETFVTLGLPLEMVVSLGRL